MKYSFHSRRVVEELDMALKAGDGRAARAHFALSSLHVDRMKVLNLREPRRQIKVEA